MQTPRNCTKEKVRLPKTDMQKNEVIPKRSHLVGCFVKIVLIAELREFIAKRTREVGRVGGFVYAL